jgi:hypothetical protein
MLRRATGAALVAVAWLLMATVGGIAASPSPAASGAAIPGSGTVFVGIVTDAAELEGMPLPEGIEATVLVDLDRVTSVEIVTDESGLGSVLIRLDPSPPRRSTTGRRSTWATASRS